MRQAHEPQGRPLREVPRLLGIPRMQEHDAPLDGCRLPRRGMQGKPSGEADQEGEVLLRMLQVPLVQIRHLGPADRRGMPAVRLEVPRGKVQPQDGPHEGLPEGRMHVQGSHFLNKPIVIIGGGLAGCEAAWQLAKRGHEVELREMKPVKRSPAHQSPHLAELVCSNSLRSNEPSSAVGLLKEEMRRLDSLVMAAADATAVPAGKALAVDRTLFSEHIEKILLAQQGLRIVRGECKEIPADAHVIIATGPLTSDALAGAIARLIGQAYLHFYDAIAPILDAGSIDHSKVFRASRYDEGE